MKHNVLRIATAIVLTAGTLSGTAGTAHAGGKNDLSASPRRLSFGSVPVGFTVTMEVTITNTGTTATNFTSGVTLTGWFGYDAGLNHCAITTLAAGESCTLTVRFSPGVTGHLTGTLTFFDTNPPTTFDVPLVGRGT